MRLVYAFSDYHPMTELTKAQLAKRDRVAVPYTQSVGEDICDLIVDGLTPQEACDGRDGRPSHFSTLFRWLETDDDFHRMYETAWLWRVDHMAREIVAIADDKEGDYKFVPDKDKPDGGDGLAVFCREHVSRSKLKIESRWRILATLMPRKYGAALLGGAATKPGDDAKLIESQSVKDEVKDFTTEQLRDEALAWEGKK